ncbi:MAG: radical SAM protein, partial [Treponemataceae bacterium]|nr:radical SAM protein [Treponemataceae bacterium]
MSDKNETEIQEKTTKAPKRRAKPKNIFAVVPGLLKLKLKVGERMLHGFLNMYKSMLKKRHFEGYDHMKNFSLIYLKLTPLCNLRCKMCGQRGDKGYLKGEYAANEAKSIVPLETYKKLVDELKYKRPVYYLWGGEPFLYPDLCDLVAYIQKSGSFCSVNTNGTLLEKYAERIVKDQWNVIFVSLDAFKDVNDEIRGPGSYDRVVKGFEAINKYKEMYHSNFPSMGIVTTVTSLNYKSLEDLAVACKDFKIDWHIYNLGTYTNDDIVAKHKQFFREKLGIESTCLQAYNTGYNNGIDGKEAHRILHKIHTTDYGYLSITVPTLNPEKTDEYYHHLDIPVRDHCIVPWT